MTEDQGADRGGERQRHRLCQVGSHERSGADRRIEEQEQHDHQRSRSHRCHPDDDSADDPDHDRGQRADGELANRADAPVSAAAVEQIADDHRAGSYQQRRTESDFDVVHRGLGVADQVQEVGAEERGRHRSDHHPADQLEVDRPGPEVDERAEGPHDDGGHEVARDGAPRLDVEEQDQHRRHQRSSARAGHSNEHSDNRATQNDVGIDVH